MSLHYELSPVQELCIACSGHGRIAFVLCEACGGIGRTYIAGGPSFGCKLTLAKCSPGSVVSIGNGDRGRVVRHIKRGTPTTEVRLIDSWDDSEASGPTWYPSATGVISVAVTYQTNNAKPDASAPGIRDQLDPMLSRRIL